MGSPHWMTCVVLCFIYVLHGKCDVPDCDAVTKSPTMALKKKLFCSYDTSVRPVKQHTNTINVSTHMWMKNLVFHEHYNTLEVHCWMIWKWHDELLSWNKNEHDEIESLNVLSTEIWSPDITSYTEANMKSVETQIPETRCTLEHDGKVSCLSPTLMTAICIPDITRWPFDSHNCTMRMGSWSHPSERVNLTTDERGIDSTEIANNRDWELVLVNATRKSVEYQNKTYVWIKYDFGMKRYPGGHASSVVAPAIILAVVTLVTFWLDPVHSHRIGLLCLNITCHCLFIIFVILMVPPNGDSTPIIVTFFRDSLLLAGISLVVALCAGVMNTTARAPPAWITAITNFVLSSPPGQIFLLGETDPKAVAASMESGGEDDGAQLVANSSSKNNGWTIFSTLLDRVCFVVFSLTLFILLCAYIP